MFRFWKYPLIVLLSFTMTGCWTYKPQLADIPLINHKGDIRAAGSLYLLPVTGLDATLSAGLTDHLAMQLHIDNEGEVFYSHLALGYYKTYESSVLEIYLGAGRGHGDVYIDTDPAYAKGPYLCYFEQTNYGWHLNAHSDIGFAVKTGVMFPYFKGKQPAFINGEETSETVFSPHSSWLLEPQLFYRIGGERIKFQIQLGYCYLNKLPLYGVLRYIPFSLSTGISINL